MLALPIFAFAQTARVTAEIGKTTVYEGLALSPDGKNLAWTQTLASQEQPKLWIGTVGGTFAPLPLAGPHTESDPSWSPDSKTLAFLSTAGEKDQSQLWILSPGTAPKKWTRLKGYAGRPRWSPDGKKIAFLYIEGGGGGGPLYAAPVQTGVIDQEIRNQRIAVVDTASGKISMASPANLYIYDFDWSPDSMAFVTTGAPGPGDNNWWIAQLYVVRDGSARPIRKAPWQLAVPRWSPDGSKISVEGDGVYVIDVGSGTPIHLTEVGTGTVSWSPDGSTIAIFDGGDIVVMNADGTDRTSIADTPARETTPMWQPNG
jgi:Tol biopolymer transport system component